MKKLGLIVLLGVAVMMWRYARIGGEVIFEVKDGMRGAHVAAELRKQGVKAGLLKIKLWRPFPFDDFKKAAKGIKVLAVLDRAISFGGPGGPVFSEVRSALYDVPSRPKIVNYIIGLGGRDVQVENFMDMAKRAAKGKLSERYEIYGVRG